MSSESETREIGSLAVKSGIWYTIGNILLKGCAFLSLPIFTRLLSTSDFGIYNTYIAYEQILTAVLGLGLYGTVKNAKIDFPNDFERYISSVYSLSVCIFIPIVILTNIAYPLIGQLLGYSRFILNCLLIQSYGGYLIYFYGIKLGIEFKYRTYLILTTFNVVGGILISIILIQFVFPNERYLGRILGSATPLIIIAVVLSIVILRKGRLLYYKEYWKYGLAIGLPLVPHIISQSLLNQFDRIMISSMVGTGEAGIYSYIYTLCTILYVVGNSLEQAWTPWVYLTINQNQPRLVKKACKDYVLFYSLLTVCFMCLMPEVIRVIANEEYWLGSSLMVPLTLSNYFIFLYSLPVNIEYYHKKTSFISIGTLSAAALNICLNYFAIDRFGYQAAAYTTLLSYISLFAFHLLIATKWNIKEIYDLWWIFKNIVIVGIIGGFLLFFERFYWLYCGLRIVLISMSAIVAFKKRNILISAFAKKSDSYSL